MKILFHRGKPGDDYMYDMLLHGLRNTPGVEVVDVPYIEQMYASTFGPGKKDIKTISAKGFTVYGLLPDIEVDRDDLERKIETGYFDLIICDIFFGPLSEKIVQFSNKNRVVFIDGNDDFYVRGQLAEKFLYFKRELRADLPNVIPISFAVPKEKIREPIVKTRAIAHIVPGDMSTYIYDEEDDYYNGYNESLFGITRCKSGWDCLRHYEILASRCVPYFVDIDHLPELTCTTLPKKELKKVNALIASHGAENMLEGPMRHQYEDIRGIVHQNTLDNCTTEAMAKYIIEKSMA